MSTITITKECIKAVVYDEKTCSITKTDTDKITVCAENILIQEGTLHD